MGRLTIRGKSYYISKERADSIRPVLRWIKDAAPRKRERQEASSILREIEGITEHKQVILTRSEGEMLEFVVKEFPQGETERQLKLPL